MKTIKAEDIHAKDLADPDYRRAYEALHDEFASLDAAIRSGKVEPTSKVTRKQRAD